MARRRPRKRSGVPPVVILIGAAAAAVLGVGVLVAVIVVRTRAQPVMAGAPGPGRAEPKAAGHAATDRVLGLWTMTAPEGGAASLEFLPGGVLKVSATRPGLNRSLDLTGRWEVVAESGDRFRLRRETAGDASEDDARFDGDDRLVIEGPRGGAVYHRRR